MKKLYRCDYCENEYAMKSFCEEHEMECARAFFKDNVKIIAGIFEKVTSTIKAGKFLDVKESDKLTASDRAWECKVKVDGRWMKVEIDFARELKRPEDIDFAFVLRVGNMMEEDV